MFRIRQLHAVALTALAVTSCSVDGSGSQSNGPSCIGSKCDEIGGSGGDGFDYIIVGSGAGGGPLASRLAQNEDELRTLRRSLAALRRTVYDARAAAEAAPAARVKARRR